MNFRIGHRKLTIVMLISSLAWALLLPACGGGNDRKERISVAGRKSCKKTNSCKAGNNDKKDKDGNPIKPGDKSKDGLLGSGKASGEEKDVNGIKVKGENLKNLKEGVYKLKRVSFKVTGEKSSEKIAGELELKTAGELSSEDINATDGDKYSTEKSGDDAPTSAQLAVQIPLTVKIKDDLTIEVDDKKDIRLAENEDEVIKSPTDLDQTQVTDKDKLVVNLLVALETAQGLSKHPDSIDYIKNGGFTVENPTVGDNGSLKIYVQPSPLKILIEKEIWEGSKKLMRTETTVLTYEKFAKD